jgi:uncharacterized protein
MAVKAVVVVNAGPDIARQSTFMRLFSFATRVKERWLPGSCVTRGFLAATLRSGLQEARGFHRMVSKPEKRGSEPLASLNVERIFMSIVSPSLLPFLMLFASNVFMTFAWYGHLKFKEISLPLVILVSWGIAFLEYWLAVPANRWGSAVYTAAQLKTIQEVITLIVFAGFSVLYLKQPLGWNHGLGFALIGLGAFFIFHKWS